MAELMCLIDHDELGLAKNRDHPERGLDVRVRHDKTPLPLRSDEPAPLPDRLVTEQDPTTGGQALGGLAMKHRALPVKVTTVDAETL
jgi:hypothetical protein